MPDDIRHGPGMFGGFRGLSLCLPILLGMLASPALGEDITYEYDDFGRLTAIVHDGGSRVDYEYDNAGNRTKRTVVGLGVADLQVTIADAPDPAYVGGTPASHVVTVTNTGPDAAGDVLLGLSYTGAADFTGLTPSQGSCDGTLVCNFGALANNASASATLVLTPSAAGQLTVVANATSGEQDPDPVDDTAVELTTVKPFGSNCLVVPLLGFYTICAAN